jgi:hypothetical protein
VTIVDKGNDLTQLAQTDRRVARDLAAAERDRVAAQQRQSDQDAALQRRLLDQDATLQRRMAEQEGRLRLSEQRDQVKANREQRRRAERDAAREQRRKEREQRREARQQWVAGRVAYVRDNAAAVYSALIYGLAVSGAVYGQVDAARVNGLPVPVGIVAALALEGTGLAMALTAQHQRLKGERAVLARALIWICTAGAVTINAIGHHADPVKAIGLSALSALGIIVYEVRSGAKHRVTLRKLGVIPEPPERFGWRRWLTYPRQTWTAWRIDARDRLSPSAAALISRADAVRAQRRRQQLVAEVAGTARKAARAAAKKGEAGAALAALARLANTGTPAPLLALPSPGRVEVEAARRALVDAQARLAQEVKAREAAQGATAEAEAEVVRVRQEAEAAIAAVRAQAEAEVRAARQRVEAEAARRGAAEAEAEAAAARFRSEAARRQEAEARATSAGQRAEAEAQRAAQLFGQAEAAGQSGAQARHQVGQEQQARIEAEARAVTAERLLAAEQQRATRAERQAQAGAQQMSEALEQAAELRVQLAEAQAGRRARRTATAGPATPAEPLLFKGRPVPVVPGVGEQTVLRVLQARDEHPEATQKELAQQLDTSVRTVGAVLRDAGVTALFTSTDETGTSSTGDDASE